MNTDVLLEDCQINTFLIRNLDRVVFLNRWVLQHRRGGGGGQLFHLTLKGEQKAFNNHKGGIKSYLTMKITKSQDSFQMSFKFKLCTHFYRIREESGSGCPLPPFI